MSELDSVQVMREDAFINWTAIVRLPRPARVEGNDADTVEVLVLGRGDEVLHQLGQQHHIIIAFAGHQQQMGDRCWDMDEYRRQQVLAGDYKRLERTVLDDPANYGARKKAR